MLRLMDELDFVAEYPSRSVPGTHAWRLKERGLQQLYSASRFSSSTNMFEVRPLPLEDLTSYELLATLRDRGWEWREWIPPSRRKKTNEVLAIAYTSDSEKVWFSTAAEVSHGYLHCLCDSEARNQLFIISIFYFSFSLFPF